MSKETPGRYATPKVKKVGKRGSNTQKRDEGKSQDTDGKKLQISMWAN